MSQKLVLFTTTQAAQAILMESELFDLVVIDEACGAANRHGYLFFTVKLMP
jgi:hypothetical protein